MKKIVDDWRLIYKVCSLYYEDDMRQQEVSDYLGISRATVSRMLQKGKESGIVRVEVINPVQFSYNKHGKGIGTQIWSERGYCRRKQCTGY